MIADGHPLRKKTIPSVFAKVNRAKLQKMKGIDAVEPLLPPGSSPLRPLRHFAGWVEGAGIEQTGLSLLTHRGACRGNRFCGSACDVLGAPAIPMELLASTLVLFSLAQLWYLHAIARC